jgi:two-component system, cell cycle response regulator
LRLVVQDDAASPPAHVLLVEDDPHVQRLGELILGSAGHVVRSAGTCAQALQLLSEQAPDVVLLDVHLPDGLGLDVLVAMQQDAELAAVPVIVVTGSMEAGAVRALDAGAHDYLPKPFEPEELLARVRAALRVKHARDELSREARLDVLTGLANRRALDETLATATAHCARRQEPLSVALMDVIDFKGVNDVHGHAVGDDVLRRIGRTLQGTRRTGDVVGRWGGDEFLAILPGAGVDEAALAVARLQRTVTSSLTLPGRTIELRAGIATRAPDGCAEGHELVRAAAARLRDVHAGG